MRVLVATAVCLLSGAAPLPVSGQAASPSSSPNQAPYTLKVNTRVVLTDVTVTDKHGNPITGLTENDFRLIDNKKPQKLASFEEHRQVAEPKEVSAAPGHFNNKYAEHPPAQVNALLFDTTTIGIEDQMYLFQQMKQFVNDLPDGQQVAVFMRVGSATIQVASFTDDHEKLLAAIGKAIPRLPQPGAWMASDLDTLREIGVYLYQIPGRKNLLWFTGGASMFLRPDAATVMVDPAARRAVYDLLESERIAMYPIDARGLRVVFGHEALANAMQQIQMRQDAAATGGAAYVNRNDLAQAAHHILATDGNYYTLSYTPNDLKNNSKWHQVDVKLANADYELSYRHGYFDDGAHWPQSPWGTPQPAKETRTALRAGGNKAEVGVPPDPTAPLVFHVRIVPTPPGLAPQAGDFPLKKGETRYFVDYDVPARDVYAAKIQGNNGTDELGAAVFVYDRDGGLVSRKGLKFALGIDEQKLKDTPDARLYFSQTINLPQGSNFLYLGLWDMTTGRMGTVNAAVDVRKP
jgi:VWFA-related protein